MKFLFSLILILFFSFKEINNLKICLFLEIIVKLQYHFLKSGRLFPKKINFFKIYIIFPYCTVQFSIAVVYFLGKTEYIANKCVSKTLSFIIFCNQHGNTVAVNRFFCWKKSLFKWISFIISSFFLKIGKFKFSQLFSVGFL